MATVVLLAAGFASLFAGCTSGTTVPKTRALLVSDDNNRVVVYNSPFITGQSANVVLGQSSFTTSVASLTATGMTFPYGTAEDGAGNIYVADYGNNRILQFKQPLTNGMGASLAIGQPDFTTGTANTTQNGLHLPLGLAFDSAGNLWVADIGNHRVLQYKPPLATNMNANLVLGQVNFTSGGHATTSSGLWNPSYIAFDASGNLWVTDSGNNRVLEFKPPFATAMAAGQVIGQADFVSSGAGTTASRLDYPAGIAIDTAGNLWVGELLNNRVMQFKPPFANGMNASLALGQASFTASVAATTQSGLSGPYGMTFDGGGNLWVADGGNSRVLEFTPPFSNNQNASVVLGQANFTTSTAATTAAGQSDTVAVSVAF